MKQSVIYNLTQKAKADRSNFKSLIFIFPAPFQILLSLFPSFLSFCPLPNLLLLFSLHHLYHGFPKSIINFDHFIFFMQECLLLLFLVPIFYLLYIFYHYFLLLRAMANFLRVLMTFPSRTSKLTSELLFELLCKKK